MRVEETKKMVDTAIEELAQALECGQSETLKAYLAAMGRFHRYSLGNAILIALARPAATRVAGFRTWQKLGRQVRKGERGIAILALIVRRRDKRRRNSDEQTLEQEHDLAAAKPTSDDEERVVAFRTAHVFDISQTDGKELPEFAVVQGEPGMALERLKHYVASRGLRLQYAPFLRGAEGLAVRGTIVLRTGLSSAKEYSTLLHELAHEQLHHDGVERPKIVKETEAEAVAYAVCAAAGLELNSASSVVSH